MKRTDEQVSKVAFSLVLFFSQLILLIFLLFSITPPCSPISLLLIASGIILAVWSIVTMRESKLNVLPDVMLGASLVTTGPYAYIRHPMYTAIIFIGLAAVLHSFDGIIISAFIGLCVVLGIKSMYEESLLKREFSGYSAYMKKTKRFIPFIF